MPETMLVATLEPARQVTRMCTGMPATDPALEEKGLCQPWQTGTLGWRGWQEAAFLGGEKGDETQNRLWRRTGPAVTAQAKS